jgi:branched-subunit amino acid transport protein
MNEFYLIAGMALVTFIIRYSMIAVAGRAEFPTWLNNALRYVPPAVLTAIITPAVLMPDGPDIKLNLANPYLVGAVIAFGVGWFTKNILLTIIVGMAAFLSWQWFLLS